MAREPASVPAGGEEEYERRGSLWLRTSRTVQQCLTTFRRVVGMPDYAAYLEHLARRHPDWPAPSQQEFFRLYIESRYGNGASRCC